ncbi:MAG: adenylosuccinate lyase [Candidatus Kapaibacteriota bacterium]
MIARYTRKEMADIWSDENKYNIWLEIELLAAEAQAELGFFPKDKINLIRKQAKIDSNKILEIEQVTKHDVIAFLTNLEESIGELSSYIHFGMTSSDVLDTAFSLQIVQAGNLLLSDLEKLKNVLKQKALDYKYLVSIGRTHGIHAEPITFGLKFALWYEECNRNIERLRNAIEDCSVGMISGAVGTYEHIPPFVEEYVCKHLGLRPEKISTQVIQRDHHSTFMSVLAIIASTLEKMAIELRHLQRTEVLEAEEDFTKGQKGSSAMPHKRNPISAENVTGQARLIRSYALAAFENNALWHERDISHSSVERVIFPDATISLDYIINRMINLISNLKVYPENIERNLQITKGLIFSQKILLFLANKEVPRQKAYEIVQESAMRTWNEGIPFFDSLKMNKVFMSYTNENELAELFNYNEIFKSVDYIYERIGLITK